jgi:hypothetical protein
LEFQMLTIERSSPSSITIPLDFSSRRTPIILKS